MALVEDRRGDRFLRLRIRWEGAACVLELEGELDLSTGPTLGDALLAIAEAGCDDVIVDMAEVQFVDVTGLQPLIDASIGARRRGRRLVLRDVPTSVVRILMIAPAVAEALPIIRS
jgi:anti-anti-sigma factor